MAEYDIWHIYDEMEKYLMASMSRNLKRHLKEEAEYGFDWEQWQAAKLREMRKFRKQNQKIIGKHTKNLAPDIKQHLENEYKQGLVGVAKKYAEQFGENKFTKDLSDGFFGTYDEKVKALINAVNDDLKAANHAALRMSNDAYRQVIHKAAMFAGNGVMTEKQAIDMALQEFKKRGLNCIKYKNGARHNIKEYADMALRTAEMRAMLIGEGKARQELGETLVQISRHGTACPLCVPWENKVLIDDVYSGGTWENSKAKYEQVPASKRGESPFLSRAMLAGLYHPRCRHGLGTYYIELQDDYKPIEAEKPKEPEKTAEEIAAEEAAAKAAKLAQQEAEKMAKFKQLYNLNWEDTLTPEQMAKITALEDDLMLDGNFEEYEQWAAKKQAELQAAYEEAYKWYGKDYGSLSFDEQQKYDNAFNALIDADLTKTPQKQQKKFDEWAANRAKLEAEAKAAKIKADTEKLHKALYTGQTGPDIDALKQSILDDAEYLDAYNAMAEPIYDGAKAELNFKKAILKDAKKAVADADAAEKAAKKAAKDAQDAADMAANDAAIGWLPNYDQAYFAKYGKYPIHTDPNYIINKNKWRSAKYANGLDGADLEAVIEKMADSDLPNYELKKAAMQKEAADKAAELAAKKAEKKAAKKAEKQAQIEADKAKEEFDKAERSMLKSVDDTYSQERKDNAYWFTSANGGTKGADGILRDTAGEVWRGATKAEKDYVYEYTRSYHKYNEPLRGIEYGTNNFLGVGNVDLDAIGTNYGGFKRGEIHSQMKHIESIIDKAEMPEDMWVQRGCSLGGMDKFFGIDFSDFYLSEAELSAKLLDTEPVEYAFMSCGVSKGMGLNTSGGVVLNIYCPKGTKGMYLEPISAFGKGVGRQWDGISKQTSFGHESEILLQHGTKMRVTKVQRSGGTWYIDVDVIEQGVNTI